MSQKTDKSATLQKAALSAVSATEVRAIVAVLKRKAMEGDRASARLLFAYILRKPGTAQVPKAVPTEPVRMPEFKMHIIDKIPGNARDHKLTTPAGSTGGIIGHLDTNVGEA